MVAFYMSALTTVNCLHVVVFNHLYFVVPPLLSPRHVTLLAGLYRQCHGHLCIPVRKVTPFMFNKNNNYACLYHFLSMFLYVCMLHNNPIRIVTGQLLKELVCCHLYMWDPLLAYLLLHHSEK